MMMVLFLGEVQGRYCYHQWGLDDAERGRLFCQMLSRERATLFTQVQYAHMY